MTEEELMALMASGGLLGGGYPVASMGYASGATNPAAASAAEGYAGALGFNIGPRGGLVYRPWEMEAWRDTGIPMELWNANLPGGAYGGGYGGAPGAGWMGGVPGAGLLGGPGTTNLPRNWQDYLDWVRRGKPDNGEETGNGKDNGNGNGNGNGDDTIPYSLFWPDYDPDDPTQWHPPLDFMQDVGLNRHDPRPPFTQWQQWMHNKRYPGTFNLGLTPMGTTEPTATTTPAVSTAPVVTAPPVIPPLTPASDQPGRGGPSLSDLMRQAAADQAAEDARRAASQPGPNLLPPPAPITAAPAPPGMIPVEVAPPPPIAAPYVAPSTPTWKNPNLVGVVPTARYGGTGFLTGL